MRILVTGAGGFVGGHMIKELAEANHDVIACSRVPFKSDPGVPVELFDIESNDEVKAIVDRQSPTAIIHLAAQASVQKSWEEPSRTQSVNVVGTASLLEAVAKTGNIRLLIVGSAQQYGDPGGNRALTEEDPQDPRSPYALSKVSQEKLAMLYHREFGVDVVATRAFNQTGPGQSSHYVIGSFCSQIAAAESETSARIRVGRLSSVRDFLDVRDVAAAYRALVEKGTSGQIYNVSSGQGSRVGDLLETLIDAADLREDIEVVETADERPGDPQFLVGSNRKIREGVGWEPMIRIETSILETLDWYRNRLIEGDRGKKRG